MFHGRWRSAWAAWVLVAGASGCGPDVFQFEARLGTDIRPLTRGEVASIAAALNSAEISAGRTAELRTTNAKVKALARQIIDVHASVNVRISRLPDLPASRLECATAVVLRSQSRLADQRLGSISLTQLDAEYLANELKVQAQALTVIRCALRYAGQDAQVALLLSQLEERMAGHVRAVVQLRGELSLPDDGEATVVGCVAMCARPEKGEAAPSLPENLKATLCL